MYVYIHVYRDFGGQKVLWGANRGFQFFFGGGGGLESATWLQLNYYGPFWGEGNCPLSENPVMYMYMYNYIHVYIYV